MVYNVTEGATCRRCKSLLDVRCSSSSGYSQEYQWCPCRRMSEFLVIQCQLSNHHLVPTKRGARLVPAASGSGHWASGRIPALHRSFSHVAERSARPLHSRHVRGTLIPPRSLLPIGCNSKWCCRSAHVRGNSSRHARFSHVAERSATTLPLERRVEG